MSARGTGTVTRAWSAGTGAAGRPSTVADEQYLVGAQRTGPTHARTAVAAAAAGTPTG
jgi:hypothetical protein